MLLYAMPENMKLDSTSPFVVSMEDALRINESKDYGIFRCVNEFEGRRKKDCLKRITAWHVDIDKGSKQEQILKINNSPIWPSRIVESKNGFHIYFNAIEANLGLHSRIIKGLNAFFEGDEKAKMVTVLLREPGFWHKKDPSDPFKVVERSNIPTRYTDEDMMYFFPVKEKYMPEISKEYATRHGMNLSKLSEFLGNLDHEWALGVISGKPCVGGETYTFKEVGNNHKNIFVNGKSTSCFIDADRKIGATHGPTLWQWLSYFNHDNKTIYRMLKEHFGGAI